MEAGAGALADGVEAGQRGAPVEIDRDPAHRVVGGGGDRDRFGARVEPRLGEQAKTLGKRAGSIARRSRPTEALPSSRSLARIAALTSSRGASSSVKRSPSASSSLAPSPRIASVIRAPSKRVSGRASAVGWNWQNSRSARSAPAAAPKTGPAPIAPRGLVVRRHSAAAPPVASTVAREPKRARRR